MTELSDELLVAYVDGQLARDQSKAVERVLEHDEVAAQRVEAMQAAHSRLEAAFEAMLANELSAMTAVPGEQANEASRASARSTLSLLRRGGAIAVVGGAVCLLMAGAVAGYALRATPEPEALVPTARVPLVTGAALARDWQDDLIIAHALFSRDSLTVGLESQGNIDLLRFHLGNVIGTEVHIPDLGPAGLAFKRAQILTRQDRAIVQLAYLPLKGQPVALYLQWDKGADNAPAFSRTDGLAAAEWRQGNITYFLVGAMQLPRLEKLAAYARQQIAASNSLSSNLTVPPTAAEARRAAVDPAPAEVEAGTTPVPSVRDDATAAGTSPDP
jgi:anti-sigma factor RsiW